MRPKPWLAGGRRAIEPVAIGAARGGRDRGDAAQMRQGSLTPPPLGLSPAVTSSCSAVSAPDPGQGQQGGCDGADRGLGQGRRSLDQPGTYGFP